MKGMERICFLLVILVPPAFFLPNILAGGVMLPLDLLHHYEPFAQSLPIEMARVHNPHLADLVALYHPGFELLRAAAGIAPLWNPYSFCGSPALANAQNGVLFPLTWLVRILPFGAAYLLIALAKMWFCGIFAFLFYRRMEFHPLAALSGSLGFMLGGHMIVWFGYPTSYPLVTAPFSSGHWSGS